MTYTPRPNSLGAQILAQLQQQASPMTRRQLADALGQPIQNINRPIMMAVGAGGVAMHGAGRGKTTFTLPSGVPAAPDVPLPKPRRLATRAAAARKRRQATVQAAPEPQGPIGCLYSDGDVALLGVTQCEDGTSCTMTDAQARRVHAFLERIYGPNQ